jgi:hypothetical protein
MPFIYTLGFRPDAPTTASDWAPSGDTDWAFSSTTPFSEFLWGTWMWFGLVAIATLPPHRPARICIWFESLVMFVQALFLGSIIYYATVVQHDVFNYLQSLWGLTLSAVGLLALQIRTAQTWRPALSQDESAELPPDSPTIVEDGSISSFDEPHSGLLRKPLLFWMPRGEQPYAAATAIVGAVSLVATTTVLTLCFVVLVWNWSAPRYCVNSAPCWQKA